MLCLYRETGERIRLKLGGIEVWIAVMETRPGRVRLAFDAPPEVQIAREEVIPQERKEQVP